MKAISQITLPDGLEIDLLYANGKLAYTFEHNSKSYGNAIALPSKSIVDIASACLILFTNAVDTKKTLQ